MIIENSTMILTSSHSLQESTAQEQSLRFWTGNPSPAIGARTPPQAAIAVPTDSLEISQEAQQLAVAENKDAEYTNLSPEDESKIRALQAMLEAFTGKKFRFVIPRLEKCQALDEQTQVRLRSLSAEQPRAGWGLEYNSSRTHSEQEQLSFAAEGIVKTADGREINLSLELSMSRAFYSREEFHLRAGDAAKIDPLVINFAAPAAMLTTNKFSFDLDADGTADKISFVKPGSGFLTLDLNKDGVVNDGKELFGPQSGNGFSELTAYDSDGNNWIDENDPIWDQLRIWTKDDAGQDVLFALGEKGVGAIYLGNIATDFALKDTSNQQHGQLKSSSIFLRENGTASTVQQVDLIG